MHYRRWQKWGDPLKITRGNGLPELDRFWRLVDRGGPDDCWPFLGHLIRGYGQFARTGATPYSSHRYAYELLVGPIPPGATLDHLCHSASSCVGGPTCPHRRCCNPAHLEPCSRGENVLRGNSLSALNAAKVICGRGHPFTEANTRINPANDSRNAFRVCRTCARENAQAWRDRRRRR